MLIAFILKWMIVYVIKQIKFDAKIGTPISKQKLGNFILVRL